MKLLLLLNENPSGAHEDVHRTIENCYEKGIISDKIIYPFLAKFAEGLKEEQVLNEIIEISKNFQPALILWMHTDKFKVDQSVINELNNLINKPAMGYWDGDLYQGFYRPVPTELLDLSSACDVVFVQGFSEMTKKMKNRGCKDIRFVPAFSDTKRFYSSELHNNKEYDIVMIGNNITSRNPLRITMPGTRFRKKMVAELSKKYQNRFAVFGNNWKGNYAKGISSYLDQHKIYSNSKITVQVNNYYGKYYFSDHLPIAMLSGIPIVHNYEEGFDELFKDCKEIRFFKSIKEGFKQCEDLLNKSDAELNEIGCELQNYAIKKLTVELAFEYMINVLKEIYVKKNNSDFNYKVANPWLEGSLK